MRNGKGNIQDGCSSRHSTPFSGLWKPRGATGASSSEGAESSNRYSYQSIGNSASSSMARRPQSCNSLGYQSNFGNTDGHGKSSIRNSAHSLSNAWGFRQLHWCVDCYEAKFVTIEPVLFIVMFAVYLHKIVFELYTFNFFARQAVAAHNGSGNTSEECASTTALSNSTSMEGRYSVNLLWSNRTGDIVEKDTGILIMIVTIVMGACSLVGTLMLGPLSNRFGRKPVLLAVLAGLTLQALVTVLLIKLELNIHYFILGSGLRGMTGGVAGVYTVAYSYIAEFSQDKKMWLVVRIGVVETLSFVAVSLGLVAGGLAVDELDCDFNVPAFVVLGCVACAFIYTAIATADSRNQVLATSANQSPLPQKTRKVDISPRALVQGARMFCSQDYPRSKLWLILLVMVVSVVNSSGVTAVMTLFLLHQPLAWSPLYIGGFLGMSEFIHGLVLVVLLPTFLSLGVHDGTIVSLSIMMTVAMNVTLAFVDSTWQVFLIGIVQSIEVLIVPTLKAMLSKAIPAEEKGILFAFVSVVQVLSVMVGAGVYIPVYILSLNGGWPPIHSSGDPFLLMAVVYTLTLPLMCILSLSDYLARRRNHRAVQNPLLFDTDGPSTASVDGQLAGQTPRLQAKHTFDVSIGQDVVDREGSLSSVQSQQQQRREDRSRDLLEHSYSSLSDYHANKP